MAFRDYDDPELLKRIQSLSLQILNEFIRVCRVLEIPYVAYSGTALGAVRHSGFIPWDDDVDVALLRSDYERFLSEAPSVLSEGFEIQNIHEDPEFPNAFSNLGLTGTLFISESMKNSPFRRQFSIDIFPLDNLGDDERSRRKQCRSARMWGRLLVLRATPLTYLELRGWRRVAVAFLSSIAHWLLKTFGVTPRRLYGRWEKAARRFESQKTKSVADFSVGNPLKWSASHDEIFPSSELPFEGIAVCVPKDVDALLTREYGNYMSMPPEIDRHNHLPFHLDFGRY